MLGGRKGGRGREKIKAGELGGGRKEEGREGIGIGGEMGGW